MSWNYRIMSYAEGGLGVHEVYYDDVGNVTGWTEKPMITGDTREELIRTLAMMLRDVVVRFPDSILSYEAEVKE